MRYAIFAMMCAMSARPCMGQATTRPDLSQPTQAVGAVATKVALTTSAAQASDKAPGAASSARAGIKWVRIPGGSFMMGDDVWGDSKPRHQVAVKSFQMAKTLVTNKQYKACVAAGACTAASDYGDKFNGDDQPVVGVDWNQINAFSEWVGGRLPSEAEWEYAARSGGKEKKYPWGDEQPTCERVVMDQGGAGCGRNATWPVCSKPAGNTEQGLCDMVGNASEWVQDWYHDSYNGAPSDGSAWESPAGSLRIVRGGSWGHDGTSHFRAAYRGSAMGGQCYNLGFRPVRSSKGPLRRERRARAERTRQATGIGI